MVVQLSLVVVRISIDTVQLYHIHVRTYMHISYMYMIVRVVHEAHRRYILCMESYGLCNNNLKKNTHVRDASYM